MSERKRDYSTARADGMEFIANRWAFTGDKGYRVVFDGTAESEARGEGGWSVYSYAGSQTRVVGTWGMGLTEDAAHELAARLARQSVHPAPVPAGTLVCGVCGDRVADGDAGREGASLGAPCTWLECDGTYRDPE